MDHNRVIIFDTTLRDGEQSPGISLNTTEKLEIAHQLARLGVDVIEAGFPIASPGDFEAVQAIAREVHGPVIAGLARAHAADIERAAEAVRDAERPAHPHVHLHVRHPHRAPAAVDARGRAGPGARRRRARALARRRRRVLADGRHPRRRRVHRRGRRRPRSTRARPRSTSPTPSATRCRTSTPRSSTRLYELVPGAARRRAVRPLPRRPRPGRRQLVRRPAGGRAPGRVRDQRHRRARRQRLARGDRDAAAHARGRRRLHHRRQHARDRAHEPARLAPDRLRRCSRTRRSSGATRSRTSPASTRTACSRSARPTRSWTRRRSGSTTQLDRARQALRPPRAAVGAGGAGLRGRGPGAQHGVQALQGDRGQEEAGHRDGPRGARHRRAPRRDAPPTRSSGSTSRPPRGARRTRRSRSARRTARSSSGDFTGDGPVDAIFRAINAATRREARLREFRIDAVTGGQDALGEASVILELDGPVGRRPGRLDRHHRGRRARLRARALQRRAQGRAGRRTRARAHADPVARWFSREEVRPTTRVPPVPLCGTGSGRPPPCCADLRCSSRCCACSPSLRRRARAAIPIAIRSCGTGCRSPRTTGAGRPRASAGWASSPPGGCGVRARGPSRLRTAAGSR